MKNIKLFCRFVILFAVSFASILHVQAAFLADSHIGQVIHQVRTPIKEGPKSIGVQADAADDLVIESLQVRDYDGNFKTPLKNSIIKINQNSFTMTGVVIARRRADNTKTHDLCMKGSYWFVNILHCFTCTQADYTEEELTDTPGIYRYTLNKTDKVSYPNVDVKVTECYANFNMADNTVLNKKWLDVPYTVKLATK